MEKTNKVLTVKEILDLDLESFKELLTHEQYNRILDICTLDTFLDGLKDSAKLGGQAENEEHISINAYLDDIEEMRSYDE